jgi:hypothetical protein
LPVLTIPDVADWFAERNVMEGRAGIAGHSGLMPAHLITLPISRFSANGELAGAMSRMKLSFADGLTFRPHSLLS